MKTQGHKFHGAAPNRWATVTRMVDTGMPEPISLDIPRNLEPGVEHTLPSRPGKLVYVRWDGQDEEDPNPHLQLNLEVESAIESLGKIVEGEEE